MIFNDVILVKLITRTHIKRAQWPINRLILIFVHVSGSTNMSIGPFESKDFVMITVTYWKEKW